jgi:hypothetical protein
MALSPWDRIASGPLAGFLTSPGEHVINEAKASTVRNVKGTVLSAAGPWPAGAVVVFELRGPAPSTAIRGVRVTANGGLELTSVAAGTYRFKATAAGWQSVTATLVVSETATDDAAVQIVLPLGV